MGYPGQCQLSMQKSCTAQYPSERNTQYYPNAFIANLIPYCFDTCLFYTKISFLHILITVIEMAATNAKHTATHSPLLTENIRHSQWIDVELVALSRIDWYGQHFCSVYFLNPLNAELNPICHLLALLGVHHFLQVSRIRAKSLTLRLLMSYIYGAPIFDVSRSHTTTHHSR